MKIKQAGMTLMEVALSLVVLSTVSMGAVNLADLVASNQKASVAGQDMVTFSRAVKAYIEDNSAAVAGVATATTPALINVATLTAVTASNPSGTNYLPVGFLPTNSFGQRYCALVLEPAANILNPLAFTEGGTSFNDIDLAQVAGVAAQAGVSGGGIYASDPANARGVLGAWSVPVAGFSVTNNLGTQCDGATAGVAAVTEGHPAVALWLDSNSSTIAGALYRDAIPGKPYLNRMNAPLNAVSNITNVGALAGTSLTADRVAVSGTLATPLFASGGNLICNGTNNGVMTPGASCVNGVLTPLTYSPWPYKQVFRRVTITSTTSTWTVPAAVSPQNTDVKNVIITAAGGGGSAQGWRITNTAAAGHSGGVVMNYPLKVVPGEVLTITAGNRGTPIPSGMGGLYVPTCGSETAGQPTGNRSGHTTEVIAADAPGTGNGSYTGVAGGLTSISSNVRGILLQCGGGAGASPGRIGDSGSYVAPNTTAVPYATTHNYPFPQTNLYGWDDVGAGGALVAGAVYQPASIGGGGAPTAGYNEAGKCAAYVNGAWVPIGSGTNGQHGLATNGTFQGGISPIGYGSGGAVRVSTLQVWDTPVKTGVCVEAMPAQNGIVYLDYPYSQ